MAKFENGKDHWVKSYPGNTIPDGIVPQINADLAPLWTHYNAQGGLDVWVAVCAVAYTGSALAGFGNTPQAAYAQLADWSARVGSPTPRPLEEFVGRLIEDGEEYDGEPYYRHQTFREAIEAGEPHVHSGYYILYKFATPYIGPLPGEMGWGVTRLISDIEMEQAAKWWERPT